MGISSSWPILRYDWPTPYTKRKTQRSGDVMNTQSQIALVERKPMLEYIEAKLRELSIPDKHPKKSIVNIYGISGVGKSFVMRQIFEYFKQSKAVALFDFADVQQSSSEYSYHVEGEKGYSWEDIIKELQQTDGFLRGVSLEEDVHDQTPSADQQVIYVSEPADLRQKLGLLLLDSVDDLPYWKWLQQRVIKPLLEKPETLVVVTSQSPIFWHFWELRDLCETVELKGFSEEETREFLRYSQQDALTQMLYQQTLGYPRGLNYIVQLLDTKASRSLTDVTNPQISGLFERFSPETQPIITYTGWLRQVEVSVMRQVLARVFSEQPEWQSDQSARRSLERALIEVRAQGYLQPLRKGQPVQFDPAFRHALEMQLRSSEPELYSRISIILTEIYYNRVFKNPISDIHFFNDWLYFSAIRIGASVDQRDRWYEELERLVERVKLASPEMERRFNNDHELHKKLQEVNLLTEVRTLLGIDEAVFRDVMNQATFDTYRSAMIERFKQSLPDEVQKNLMLLLKSAMMVGPTFSVAELREQVQQDASQHLLPGEINQSIPILHSRGFLLFDRPSRSYRLNPILIPLVLPTIPEGMRSSYRVSNI
jgi:hypothetical protein